MVCVMPQEPAVPQRRRAGVYLDPEKVRRRRVEKGLFLTTLASNARISKGHLSMIETGRRGGTAPVLARIAAALDCSVSDLLPDRPSSAAS